MFGMGFMEILLIAVIAIIALGPEKLPTAMVEIAKFIKKFKSGVEDAKSALDNELNISEMKEEAAKYKAQIEDAKSILDDKNNVDLGLDDILNEDKVKKTTKKKEKNKEKISLKESKDSNNDNENSTDKFKVNIEDDKKEDK